MDLSPNESSPCTSPAVCNYCSYSHSPKNPDKQKKKNEEIILNYFNLLILLNISNFNYMSMRYLSIQRHAPMDWTVALDNAYPSTDILFFVIKPCRCQGEWKSRPVGWLSCHGRKAGNGLNRHQCYKRSWLDFADNRESVLLSRMEVWNLRWWKMNDS